MREILFRGFHPDENGKEKVFVNGKWIKGTWVKGNHLYNDMTGKHYIVPLDNIVPFGNITESEKVGQDGCCYCVGFEVIPETVGQYTELDDKNGKKIFGGDVVTGYFNHEKIIGYIFYGSEASFFIERKGTHGIGLNNASVWVEVIGNIYDNPEMLEAKNEKR